MGFEVLLTEDANRDLEELDSYVVEHDTPGKTEDLLDRIADVVESRSSYPNPGSYPTERAQARF